MTGRRLYELVTDSVGATSRYGRSYTQLPEEPKAWGVLNGYERSIWNRAAARIPKRKAVRA